MRLPLPVIILLLALSVAAYFVYPYYEEWQIWDAEFDTQVYNINDERMGAFKSTQYDYKVRISASGAFSNNSSEQQNDYTNTRTVTFVWDFATRDHGRTDLVEGLDGGLKCWQHLGNEICERQRNRVPRPCYYKTVELPPRKKGQNSLFIGVYDRDVLRIRWGDNQFLIMGILDGKFTAADAWKHGMIPLSSNWRKADPTNWPERTTWNEAVDGPRIDALGNGAWITVKADYSKPCGDE